MNGSNGYKFKYEARKDARLQKQTCWKMVTLAPREGPRWMGATRDRIREPCRGTRQGYNLQILFVSLIWLKVLEETCYIIIKTNVCVGFDYR
ncbi:hypothetical protein HanPI659440_Chr06g0240801 [Helianthus annuus]|nr:hypothetical protein HanPI659440_Chr06g0240801 [Helianthus annuus]